MTQKEAKAFAEGYRDGKNNKVDHSRNDFQYNAGVRDGIIDKLLGETWDDDCV